MRIKLLNDIDEPSNGARGLKKGRVFFVEDENESASGHDPRYYIETDLGDMYGIFAHEAEFVREEPLNQNVRSGIMPNEPITMPDPKFEKLIRRLNKLDPGRRYLITLTNTGEIDYTITDLGKVEK